MYTYLMLRDHDKYYRREINATRPGEVTVNQGESSWAQPWGLVRTSVRWEERHKRSGRAEGLGDRGPSAWGEKAPLALGLQVRLAGPLSPVRAPCPKLSLHIIG